ELPYVWQGQELHLQVNDVDNAQETFVNGVKIGAAGSFPPNYTNGYAAKGDYIVTDALTRDPRGLWIAIRVYDHDGRGGFKGASPSLHRGAESISLTGKWDFRTGDNLLWTNYDEDRAKILTVFKQPKPAPTTATRTPPSSQLDLPQQAPAPP